MVIASMDSLRFQPPSKGRPGSSRAGRARLRSSTSTSGSQGVFATSNIHGTPEWDRAAGFSFWVKGDGTDQFGGLEFIFDDDYSVRYDLVFPVKGPSGEGDRGVGRPGPGAPGSEGPAAGRSRRQPAFEARGLWFGRWWYWGDYPALAFAIDDIRLDRSIDRDSRAD